MSSILVSKQVPRISSLDVSSSEDNGKLIELWLHDKSDTTREAYQRDIACFLTFVENKPLNLVTLEDLHSFHATLEEKGLSYSSQRRRLMAVKSLLRYGLKIGATAIDAGQAFKLKKQPATLAARILSESETLRMIHGFKGSVRDRLILKTLYATAARATELCSLKWISAAERADGKATITITGKGSKTRYVTVSAELWSELKAYRGTAHHSDPIFPSRSGKHLTRMQINRVVSAAKEQAGIDKNVSPHWLRHAHASHSLQKGAPVKLVKDTLGHASLDTTDQYLHVSPDDSSGLYLAL